MTGQGGAFIVGGCIITTNRGLLMTRASGVTLLLPFLCFLTKDTVQCLVAGLRDFGKDGW